MNYEDGVAAVVIEWRKGDGASQEVPVFTALWSPKTGAKKKTSGPPNDIGTYFSISEAFAAIRKARGIAQ